MIIIIISKFLKENAPRAFFPPAISSSSYKITSNKLIAMICYFLDLHIGR